MRARPINGGLPWWHVRPLRPFDWLVFKSYLLTIAAVVAAAWVFMSLTMSMGGLREYNANNANTVQLIHERHPIVLVRPEWISGEDVEWRWIMAEARARCAVVFILWVGGMSFFIWQYSRRRTQTPPTEHPGQNRLSKRTAG